MGRRRKPDLDAELHRLDQAMARAVLAAVTGPPPTAEGTRILAARAQVRIAEKLGEAVDQQTLALAARPLDEG